jgi:hypothetical protein
MEKRLGLKPTANVEDQNQDNPTSGVYHMKGSPVFVATFADGETVRMTTYCTGELDWERGRSLARHAWQSRDSQRRIQEFLANIEDRTPPEISSCHFEVDGEAISEANRVY